MRHILRLLKDGTVADTAVDIYGERLLKPYLMLRSVTAKQPQAGIEPQNEP